MIHDLMDRDIAYLEFMHDRLIHVYGENKDVDFLIHARKTIKKIENILHEGDIK